MKMPQKSMAKVVLIYIIGIGLANAQQGDHSFVKDVDFISIPDQSFQASQWAMCSAGFELAASIAEQGGTSQTAKLSMDMSRGASVAAGMVGLTHFLASDSYTQNQKLKQFDTRWKSAKQTTKELPKAKMTFLLANLENAHGEDEEAEFWKKIGKTLEVCTKNQKGQQAYIDIYRELAASGALTVPGNQTN